MAASTEVATRKSEIIAYDPNVFPKLVEQDPEEAMVRFAAQFAAATDLDGLFNVLEGNTARSMVGRALIFQDVTFIPYESERGIIPNAIITAVDKNTGEVLTFSATGTMMVLFLRYAQIQDQLPFEAKITTVRTRSGRDALNIARL